ncbi:hypothetical protein [Actinocrispum wychmicini]|uniref:Uncharacterized protein n=1 Tax=Actinocrispum wychmicini TaxID=1213861 RepID=A0A4R2K6H8_9PSEU|nr:hypothetical protein [Actinocrispum wychmicini]TCO61935.1 hypothetical protein EV192_10272 [Actinocrispum wychmicini]
MNTTGPWWGTPVVTFAGVLLTLFSTMWITYRTKRRETAFRWVEAKKQLYISFTQSCHDLRRLAVWTAAETEPHTALAAIRLLTVEFEIIAPPRVTEHAAATLLAAERLADHIVTIRAESRPGPGNTIAERFREPHTQIEQELSVTMREFVATARADLDVKSRFAPLTAGTE